MDDSTYIPYGKKPGFLFGYIFLIQVKSKLKGHTKRITGLAFSHALNALVSSGADAQVLKFLLF